MVEISEYERSLYGSIARLAIMAADRGYILSKFGYKGCETCKHNSCLLPEDECTWNGACEFCDNEKCACHSCWNNNNFPNFESIGNTADDFYNALPEVKDKEPTA